jgi:two-component system, OmpR family, sensor kinase
VSQVSLRARLLTGMLVLISVALVIAATSIYAEQRSFLLSHLDQRVVASAAPLSYQLGVDASLLKRTRGSSRSALEPSARPPAGNGLIGFLPSGTYGALIGSGGAILRGPVTVNYGDRRLPEPAFPSQFPEFRAGTAPRLFTVDSKRGSSVRYRVAAIALESNAGTLLIAIPLREVDQTLDRLVIVEVLVVAIVILALVALGWIVIRIALRPLDQMGGVAQAIAEGDLSRRVSPANSRTEVGRLGTSLNKMLVQIEHAFADRENSEERRRQFLSDASHELRTPLASIRGYAELFRLGVARDPEALRPAMARIEAEAERMGVLVEDLLALARLDELPEERREPVELSDLCAQAVADARAIAPQRTITLVTPERLEVLGNANALRRVLANLLANAVIQSPTAARSSSRRASRTSRR